MFVDVESESNVVSKVCWHCVLICLVFFNCKSK